MRDFFRDCMSGFLATLAAELIMRLLERLQEKGYRKPGKHFR